MPLHTLGASRAKGSVFGLTFADLMSVVMAYFFYAQPGVDPKAVMSWIIDNLFFGSAPFCAIMGTYASHKVFEWGGMAYYALLYKLEKHLPSFVPRAKVYQAVAWPWNADKKVSDEYAALERRSIAYILTYHAVVTVVQALIVISVVQFTWVSNVLKWEWKENHPDLSIADPLAIPSKATVAYQCLVTTLIAETGFYFFHRLLHTPYFYRFHKQHHEYKNSTVFATFYVGFVDSFLTDMIPVGIGILYFKMHLWTIWMCTLPLIINAMRVHCGYDTSRLYGLFDPTTTLPLCTDSERTHDMHHRLNMCNYGGAYFVLDRLFGTWMDPDAEIAAADATKSE